MFFDWVNQSASTFWKWISPEIVHASSSLVLKPTGSPNTTLTASGIIINIGNAVIQVASILAGVLGVAYLIWAGLQYIMAGGDQEKAKKGRLGVINAVIGIIIIIATYAIIRFAASAGKTVYNGVTNSSSSSSSSSSQSPAPFQTSYTSTPSFSPTPTLLP